VKGRLLLTACLLALACGGAGGPAGGEVPEAVEALDALTEALEAVPELPEAPDALPEADAVPEELTPSPWSVLPWLPPGDLHDAWGSAFEQVLAAGDQGTLLAWNGRWFLPLDAGTGADLLGVGGWRDADGHDLAAAVGASGTLLVREGQGPWAQVPTGTGAALRGVAFLGAEELLAVGAGGVIVGAGRLQEGEGAPAWQAQVQASNTGNDLTRVWAWQGDVFVTGAAGGVLRRMGGTWVRQQVTQGAIDLHGVAGVDVYHLAVVGTQGALLAYDGLGWTSQVSNDLAARDLHAAWAVGPDSLWAAGDAGVLLEYANRKWTLSGAGQVPQADWRGLFVEQGQVLRRGLLVGRGMAAAVDPGDGWRARSAWPKVTLRSATRLPDGGVLAVGDDGLVVRVHGQRVVGVPFPFEDHLRGVTLSPSGQAWVGGAGTVYRYSPSSGKWVAFPLPRPDRVHALAWPYLAGEHGLLARLGEDGAAQLLETGTAQDLNGLLADAEGGAWAVGARGTILNWDGAQARLVDLWVSDDLHALALLEGRLFAAGDHGVIASGEPMDLLSIKDFASVERLDPGLFLYDVQASPEGGLWVAGFGGRALYRDSQGHWQDVSHTDPAALFALVLTDLGGVLALGQGGTILALDALP
jgi:hypothetical protein